MESPSWFELGLVNVQTTGRFRQIFLTFLENQSCKEYQMQKEPNSKADKNTYSLGLLDWK